MSAHTQILALPWCGNSEATSPQPPPSVALWCKTPILHLPRAWIIEESHMCQLVKLDHQLWAWGSLIGPRVAQGPPWWEWEWWGRLSRSRQTVHRAVRHLRATHSGKWNGINRPVASQSTLSIYSSLLWKSVTVLPTCLCCTQSRPLWQEISSSVILIF